VIVTDDMRESDFAALEQTRELLAGNGTTFPNFIVTTPMCGPSRASILTGRYAHNHGVFENGPPPGGWPGFHERGLEEETIATELSDAGYHTVLAGKYVNLFPDEGNVPPGWDEFYGVGQIAYTDFVLNENGETVAYPAEIGAYSTDVLVNKLLDTIERAPAETPLFLYFVPMAPHTPRARGAQARHPPRPNAWPTGWRSTTPPSTAPG
jgi:arylsulfatase A-like enzyme